jgi:hypothetical protein
VGARRFGAFGLACCASVAAVSLGALPFDDSTPVAEASTGACSSVIPVDALAGSFWGDSSAGVFAGGTIAAGGTTVVAGGAAPAAATVGGITVGGGLLAAAAFLGSVYGTCKFLDWVSGDVVTHDMQPVTSWQNTTLSDFRLCSELLGTSVPAYNTTDYCRVLNFANAMPPDWRYSRNTQSSFELGGVIVPQLLQFLGAYGPVPGPSTGHWYLNPAGTAWCAFSASTTSCVGASQGTQMVIRVACAGGPGGVGGFCGHQPGTTFLGFPSLFNSAPTPILSLVPESYGGWYRQVMTDVRCVNASGGSVWVRGVSETFRDGRLDARMRVPTCAPGHRALEVRAWRVPLNTTCLVGSTLCFHADAKIYEWKSPTSWETIATAPDWQFCLTSGNDCGAPVLENDVCTWGGFTVGNDFCDPARQLDPESTDPKALPKLEPTTNPIPREDGEPATSVQDPLQPTPGSDPIPPPTGTTTVVPIDPDGETAPRDLQAERAACWPSGWGWFNPFLWVYRPITCAVQWAFVPTTADLQVRLDRLGELRDVPPAQWVDEGTAYIGGASVVFGEWSAHGPACTDVLDTQICPRDWDNTGVVPSLVLVLLGFGLWSSVVFAVWRWF